MARKKIEIDLMAVEEAAADGLNMSEVAARLGISLTTLERRKNNYAHFDEAIKRGRRKANAEVTSQLFKKIRKGDLGAIIWWEKTRKGYTDRVRQEVTGKDGGAVIVRREYTDEELEQIVSSASGARTFDAAKGAAGDS